MEGVLEKMVDEIVTVMKCYLALFLREEQLILYLS